MLVVIARSVDWLADLLATVRWSARNFLIHFGFLVRLASFHGVGAKPKPSTNHHYPQSPSTTFTHPPNQQTLHSEYQTRTNNKKKMQWDTDWYPHLYRIKWINCDADSVWFYYQQEEPTEPAAYDNDTFGCTQWQSISNSVQIRAVNSFSASYVVIFYIFLSILHTQILQTDGWIIRNCARYYSQIKCLLVIDLGCNTHRKKKKKWKENERMSSSKGILCEFEMIIGSYCRWSVII